MIVNPNDPAYPFQYTCDGEVHLGMPIRLKIAAMLMKDNPKNTNRTDDAEEALYATDALIAAYNESQEDEASEKRSG